MTKKQKLRPVPRGTTHPTAVSDSDSDVPIVRLIKRRQIHPQGSHIPQGRSIGQDIEMSEPGIDPNQEDGGTSSSPFKCKRRLRRLPDSDEDSTEQTQHQIVLSPSLQRSKAFTSQREEIIETSGHKYGADSGLSGGQEPSPPRSSTLPTNKASKLARRQPLKSTTTPFIQRRKGKDGKLSGGAFDLNHQKNTIKKHERELQARINPEELTLFRPTTGGPVEIVQSPRPVTYQPDINQNTASAIVSDGNTPNLSARSGATFERQIIAIDETQKFPSRFIPLRCPNYEKGHCPRPHCFFYHLQPGHHLGEQPPVAPFALVEQANAEAKTQGNFDLKYGFYIDPVPCKHWRNGACYNSVVDCQWAHWRPKKWETCRFFNTPKGCFKTQEECIWLHFDVTTRGHGISWTRSTIQSPNSRSANPTGISIAQNAPYNRTALQSGPSPGLAVRVNEAPEISFMAPTNSGGTILAKAHDVINSTLRNSVANSKHSQVKDVNDDEFSAFLEDEIQIPLQDKVIVDTQRSYDSETTLTLEIPKGPAFAVGLKLPHSIRELMTGKIYPLSKYAPQNVVRTFVEESVPIAHGVMNIKDTYRQAALFADNLALSNICSIIRGQQVDLLLIPTQSKTLSFLPDIPQTQGREEAYPLKFYAFDKNLLPSSMAVGNSSEVEDPQVPPIPQAMHTPNGVSSESRQSLVDTVNGLLPTNHTWPGHFFTWNSNLDALPKNIHFVSWGGWGAEKDILTQYFINIGGHIYEEYQDFKDKARKGVIIIHDSFPIGKLRILTGFSQFLMKSFNIFQVGPDKNSKKFTFKHLFQNGQAVLITPEVYKNHPDKAKSIILQLKEKSPPQKPAYLRSWKLVRRVDTIQEIDLDLKYLRSLVQEMKVEILKKW
jgi:hypothetical protein